MFTTFYNETIRKTVIGFGSLFDDIFDILWCQCIVVR